MKSYTTGFCIAARKRKTSKLEVLLPELETHMPRRRKLGCIADIPRRRIRSAEVHPNLCRGRALQTTHVGLIMQTDTHGSEQAFEVRTTEIRLAFQFGERVKRLANGVEVDIRGSIIVQALC